MKTQGKPRLPRGPLMDISIDTDLIEISKERDSSHCMIAEAVRDANPNLRSISVDLQTIRFSIPEKGIRCTYLTPRIAQLALVNFDQGVTPEPFSFRLHGAHVTSMAKRKSPEAAPRPRSPDQQEALGKARKSKDATIAPPKGSGNVPLRVGGRTAPTTHFARRRAFGLRALQP